MPSQRGTATTTKSGSSASIVLSLVSDVRPGDSLQVSMGIDVVVAVTPPAGWYLLKRTNDTAAGNDQTLETYWRLCDGTETSTYTWTLGAAEAYVAGMVAIKDAARSPPCAWDGQANAASATGTAPSLIVPPNSLIVGSFASDISPSGAVTTTSAMTTEVVDDNTGTWANLAMYLETVAAGGATGTRTCTFSAASNGSMGHLVAYAPYIPPRPTRPSPLYLLDTNDEGRFQEVNIKTWW